jgi:SMC interacting uncharacterized protein involved in chromosome segregation
MNIVDELKTAIKRVEELEKELGEQIDAQKMEERITGLEVKYRDLEGRLNPFLRLLGKS